jgi:hypothetical protein
VTRDEFLALPPGLALGIVYDALGRQLFEVDAPAVPRSPKFDARQGRKGGYCWMSEMKLDSLQYWHGRAQEEACGGGKYADKAHKSVMNLERWIAWRMAVGNEQWSGERNREQVTAQPPSDKPEIHSWDGSPQRKEPEPVGSFDDFGGAPDDGDIPF